MNSVVGSVRKRKKSRVLGEVEVVSREAYQELELDAKVEMIRALVPLGLMHVEELLDAEVTALAGERYARKDASMRGRRHGSNPGRCVWPDNGCRCGFRGFAGPEARRFRCDPTTRSTGAGRSTSGC